MGQAERRTARAPPGPLRWPRTRGPGGRPVLPRRHRPADRDANCRRSYRRSQPIAGTRRRIWPRSASVIRMRLLADRSGPAAQSAAPNPDARRLNCDVVDPAGMGRKDPHRQAHDNRLRKACSRRLIARHRSRVPLLTVKGRPDRGAVKTGGGERDSGCPRYKPARKAWSPSAARIVTAPAARRPHGMLCSDAFGLNAYMLRPAHRRPVTRERMAVLCRGSND